jgi:hypothetical protein
MRWTSCPPAAAVQVWAGLDKPWQEAFPPGSGGAANRNIEGGACVATPGGQIVCSARNHVNDGEGPPGRYPARRSLAYAEANVLARLPFGSRRDLVLTTTLQPCLQCAGAIGARPGRHRGRPDLAILRVHQQVYLAGPLVGA